MPANPESGRTPSSGALGDRCRQFFDARVRERGERYYHEGRVRLDLIEPRFVRAQVRGSSTRGYVVSVELDADGDGDELCFLHAACECPHYAGGDLCKHLWAVLLALGADGWPPEPSPAARLVMLHEDDAAYEDDPGGDAVEGWTSGGGVDERVHVGIGERGWDLADPTPVPTARRAGAGDAGAGRWRALLGAAQPRFTLADADPQALPGAPERQAWFVVEPEQSVRLGGLVIAFHHRVRRKDGTLGKIKREGVGRATLARYDDPEDRRLIALLLGNDTVASWGAYPSHDEDPGFSNARRVAPVLVDTLIPALAATGRLAWKEGEGTEASAFTPLAWDAGAPWTVHLRCDARPDDGWMICGELRRAGERVPTDAILAALDDGLVVYGAQLGRLAEPAHAPWLDALAGGAAYELPAAERAAFLGHFWTMPVRPPADLPPELTLVEVAGTPGASVSLRTMGRRGVPERDVLLEPAFVYGAHRVDPETHSPTLVDVDAGVAVHRDPAAEQAMLERLIELGARWTHRYYGSPPELRIGARRVPALQRTLVDEGWEVSVDGQRLRAPGEASLSVTSAGVDWFDLEGGIDFDGMSVGLPALLAALDAGERSVALPDGSRGALPVDWLERHGPIARLAHTADGHLRFSRGQALLLDALLAEQSAATTSVDASFAAWRERLRTAGAVTASDAPRAFHGTLREYQRVGLGWLLYLDEIGIAGCLADDMGLGKTVQVLALLEWWRSRRKRPARADLPSLVVVPRSLVWNWLDEAARFAPRLRVLDYTGVARGALRDRFDEHDLVITTYGTLRRDAAHLRERRFHYVVLDEAQAIKNASSQAFKAARLLDAERRLAVSGTPVENHLGELWSLFEFLNPGLLGSAKAFARVARPSMRSDHETARRLGEALGPFILRRTKEQVLDDLPEKTEQTLMCELPPKQRRHYDELRAYYRARLDERIAAVGLGRAKIQVLEALLRLRQAACHPGLIDRARAGEPSAKLDALLESLREIAGEGHKALVFSQFTRFLALVRPALDGAGIAYEYLDGRTRDRKAKVERFQGDPDCPVFLISLKAGGQGLNLTAADYVFVLDPWWNPAVEAQAVDRAHRIGQTRPVFAYRLIARDTVEEKILALQSSKRALAEAVIGQDESVMRRLTVQDLELLLG